MKSKLSCFILTCFLLVAVVASHFCLLSLELIFFFFFFHTANCCFRAQNTIKAETGSSLSSLKHILIMFPDVNVSNFVHFKIQLSALILARRLLFPVHAGI